MSENLIWDFTFLLVGILYSILVVHFYRRYSEAQLALSMWFLAFSLTMALGNFSGFFIYFTSATIDSVTGIAYAIPQLFSIIAVSLLFCIGLVMLERQRLIFLPILLAILLGGVILITSFNPDLVQFRKMSVWVSFSIVVIPVVILFLYLYFQSKSVKSLSFSVGMVLTLIGGISVNMARELFSLFNLLAAITIFLGIMGFFDKLFSSPESS